MSREIIGYSGKLHLDGGYICTLLYNKRRNLDFAYAYGELAWYLSYSDDVGPMTTYAPQYAKFAEKNGKAYGAYGKRIAENMGVYGNQLETVVELLHASSTTRQAVVTLWRPNDLHAACLGEKKDLPCTLTWQFLVRENQLHMVTNMRSNDVWLGMPYDIFVFTCIQILLANTLGVEPGTYTHNVGSMHLYEKNHKAAEEAVLVDSLPSPVFQDSMDTLSSAARFVAYERQIREERFRGSYDGVGSMFQIGLAHISRKFLGT